MTNVMTGFIATMVNVNKTFRLELSVMKGAIALVVCAILTGQEVGADVLRMKTRASLPWGM